MSQPTTYGEIRVMYILYHYMSSLICVMISKRFNKKKAYMHPILDAKLGQIYSFCKMLPTLFLIYRSSLSGTRWRNHQQYEFMKAKQSKTKQNHVKWKKMGWEWQRVQFFFYSLPYDWMLFIWRNCWVRVFFFSIRCSTLVKSCTEFPSISCSTFSSQ